MRYIACVCRLLSTAVFVGGSLLLFVVALCCVAVSWCSVCVVCCVSLAGVMCCLLFACWSLLLVAC